MQASSARELTLRIISNANATPCDYMRAYSVFLELDAKKVASGM
jgi:hypothetical protein